MSTGLKLNMFSFNPLITSNGFGQSKDFGFWRGLQEVRWSYKGMYAKYFIFIAFKPMKNGE